MIPFFKKIKIEHSKMVFPIIFLEYRFSTMVAFKDDSRTVFECILEPTLKAFILLVSVFKFIYPFTLSFLSLSNSPSTSLLQFFLPPSTSLLGFFLFPPLPRSRPLTSLSLLCHHSSDRFTFPVLNLNNSISKLKPT